MISISLDYSFFLQLINFLVLLFVLNVVFFKPVRNMLQKRANLTAEMKAEIDSSQENAAQSQGALAEKQLATKNQGLKLWEELKKKAQAEEMEKLQAAMQKNNDFLAQQRKDIKEQVELAGAKLDHEVEQFARDIAGKILQRSLS